MKKIFFYAAAALTLAACTSDDFVGSNDGPKGMEKGVISFNSRNAATTRNDYTGDAAATKLGNNFVVMGMKSDGTIAAADAPVFNVVKIDTMPDGQAAVKLQRIM